MNPFDQLPGKSLLKVYVVRPSNVYSRRFRGTHPVRLASFSRAPTRCKLIKKPPEFKLQILVAMLTWNRTHATAKPWYRSVSAWEKKSDSLKAQRVSEIVHGLYLFQSSGVQMINYHSFQSCVITEQRVYVRTQAVKRQLKPILVP
jgi:hypothetical protein